MRLAVLQARTTSSRLPGKVLLPILGKPMLLRQIERIRRARGIDELVVATSEDASDDGLAACLTAAGVAVHRGRLDDVLDRFAAAVARYPQARTILRLTGDCPLTDWEVIDRLVEAQEAGGFDYVSNCAPPTWPDGLDVEVLTREALEAAACEATLGSDREHVTPFIRNHAERFRVGNVEAEQDLSGLRWTVDEPEDFAFVTAVYERLYPDNPAFRTPEILALLHHEPEIAGNSRFERNEGYARSLAADRPNS